MYRHWEETKAGSLPFLQNGRRKVAGTGWEDLGLSCVTYGQLGNLRTLGDPLETEHSGDRCRERQTGVPEARNEHPSQGNQIRACEALTIGPNLS